MQQLVPALGWGIAATGSTAHGAHGCVGELDEVARCRAAGRTRSPRRPSAVGRVDVRGLDGARRVLCG